MMRSTPTTPGSSSAAVLFPPTTKGTNHHRGNPPALRSRGVHRHVMPGGSGDNQHSGSSSSSSLSSLSSPTDSQEPGGGADLTPQPHMYEYGRAQSSMVTGGQREFEPSRLPHPDHRECLQSQQNCTPKAEEWSDEGQPTGQHHMNPLSWQRHQEQPTIRHEEQPTGHPFSRQRHEEQPTGQPSCVHPETHHQGGVISGQGLHCVGRRTVGQGGGFSGQGTYDHGEVLLGHGPYNGGQNMQPYMQGQGERSYIGGQSARPYAQGQGEGSYAGGQSARPCAQGQGEVPYVGGQSARPYAQGQGEVPYAVRPDPHNHNSSAFNTSLLRTPSYPPSYLKHPDHLQPRPPYNTPHQSSYPNSRQSYTHHHTHNSAGHIQHFNEQETLVQDMHTYGLIGGWGHHYPHSAGNHTSLGSTPGPTGVPYCYLEGEGSREQILSSSHSSSQPSSLGTVSEPGYRYGGMQRPRVDTLPYDDDQEERCHSYPLYSGGQGSMRVQTQPPHRPHGSVSSTAAGSELSRHSSWSRHSERLSSDLQQHLTITEDTPAGEDETNSNVHDTKHALLTMLDSDRIEILEQPKDLEVGIHQKAALTCRARALGTREAREEGVKQQWYKGDEALEGETRVDLVFVDVQKKDIGLYYCINTHTDEDSVKKCSYVAQLAVKPAAVTSSGGSRTVSAVTEEEPKVPIIIEQPPRKIVAIIGEDLTLPLKVRGEAPLGFKWYKDSSELNYAKEPVLVIPRASYADSGQYCCSVSNHHGSKLSESFHVQVSRVRTRKGEEVSAGTGHKQRPRTLHNWDGNVISDVFLREVALVVAQQVSNWQKLVSYLGLNNSDLQEVRGQSQQPVEHALRLLCCWRERYRESRELLRKRLERAGLDFEILTSSVPRGQVQGVEHRVIAKPSITTQPQSQQVIYGQEFALSVAVESPSDPKCILQWYKNYVCLHGKTEPRLTIKSAVDSDAGEYYCMAANKGGTIDSDIAFVKIINPHAPQLSSVADYQAPHAAAILPSWAGTEDARMSHPRQSAGLSTADPSEDLIGRGFIDDAQPIEGRIGGGSGFTSLRFSSRRGSATSGDCDVEKPRVVRQPESQVVDVGDPLTLTCEAVGQGELTYLWYFNGLSLQKEDGPEYSINCFTDEDEGDYYCRVANAGGGEVNTDIAHVLMKDDD